jgi:hypothetical protein
MLVVIIIFIIIILFSFEYFTKEIFGAYEYPSKHTVLCHLVLPIDYESDKLANEFADILFVSKIEDIQPDCIYLGKERVRARIHYACVHPVTTKAFRDEYFDYKFINVSNVSKLLGETITKYKYGQQMGLIVISGCMGSGKTSIINECNGIDGDDLYIEALRDIHRDKPNILKQHYMGEIDLTDEIDSLFAKKVDDACLKTKSRIIALNGLPYPISAKYRFAVKIDNESIYKRRTKRELTCLHDNYDSLIDALNKDTSDFEFDIISKYKCMLAGVESYKSVVKYCDQVNHDLDFHGYTFLPSEDILSFCKRAQN